MRVLAQLLLTFLLNASWQVALLVAFAALCDWLLRGLARYRHTLWVITLIACLFLPLLSCLSSAPRFAPAQPAGTTPRVKPFVVSKIISPGVEEADRATTEIGPQSPAKPEEVRSNSFAPIHLNRNIAATLAGMYLLFLLWRLANLIRAWRRTRIIVKSAFEFDFPERVQTIIRECRDAVGAKRARVLCSMNVAVPITVGIISPVVILPARLLDQVDEELLTTAIGHELVHVVRRDYLANLCYEFIYLPLSFHPAAALVRRRIKQTRELCCDQSVAARLLRPEVYARSLVRLIGSAPLPHLAADTTIGINESDILEVRIMSLLKTSKLNSRGRTALLIAVSFLLLAPCVAAAKLALSFEIDRQEPTGSSALRPNLERQRQEEERGREDLNRLASELKERLKAAPHAQRAEIEAKLREVQKILEAHERAITEYRKNAPEKDLQRLRQIVEEIEKGRPANQARLTEAKEQLAQIEMRYQSDEVLRELKEKLAVAEKSTQGDRKAKLISKTEPEYSADARAKQIEGNVLLGFTVDHDGLPQNVQVKRSLYPSLDQAAVEAVRKWRFEPAMKGGQPVSMWLEAEVYFRLNSDGQTQEEQERGVALTREGKAGFQVQEFRGRLNQEAARRAEREAEEKNRAELARLAKISMDQAIQIATSKTPGKVLQCSLTGEHWEGRGELAKPGLVLYHVVMRSGDEANPNVTHVWVNALDGSIFRIEKEERRRETPNEASEYGLSEYGKAQYGGTERKPIQGGVLNGRAIRLPSPVYPDVARAGRAEGTVQVQITIDEEGNVVAAKAISGHPLLQAAAVSAAREAKFTPTRLSGEPVKVSGLIVYNFVVQ